MIAIRAPAKINLYLHVIGRQADGYHRLDSLVAFADAGDELRLAPSDDFRLTVGGPFAEALAATPERDNLITRAAHALAEALGRPPHAAVHLVKNLPVASGIGGGSADAAATLIGLCALWDVEPARGLLEPIARRLGQDIPACLASVEARFAGIGDVVLPAPALPPAWLVLANPGIALPTPVVFAAYRQRPVAFSQPAPVGPIGDFDGLVRALAQRRNDLEPVARELAPSIGDVLAALTASGGCRLARMSGSGATCFGLFPHADLAHRAAARLRERHPEWWVTAATWSRGRTPQRIAC